MFRCRKLALSTALVAWWVSAVPAAEAAADQTVRLEIVRDGSIATEPCPADVSLRESMAARLGYDPFVADGRHRLLVQLGGSRGRLRALVTLTEPDGAALGRRALRAPRGRCAELFATVALAASLAVESFGPPPGPPPRAGPLVGQRRPGRQERRPSRRPLAPTPDEPLAPDQPWRLELGVWSDAGFGRAPDVSAAVALRVGGHRGPLVLRLALAAGPPVTQRLAAGGELRISNLEARGSACWRGFGFLDLCGLVTGGAILGESSGLASDTAAWRPTLGLGVEVTAAWAIWDQLDLALEVAGVARPIATAFRVDGVVAWETSVFTARVGGGVRFRF